MRASSNPAVEPHEVLHEVLHVEDDAAHARLVRARLEESSGLRLTHAPTLAAAERTLASSRMDAVLLDLGLPDSRGLDTVGRLCGRSKEIPVVVLTGLADEDLREQALALGADDYLVKDEIDSVRLSVAVLRAIERHHLRRDLARARRQAWFADANLQIALASSLEALIVVDDASRILFANPAAARMLRRKVEDLQSRPLPFPVLAGLTRTVQLSRDGDDIVIDVSTSDIFWYGSPATLICLGPAESTADAMRIMRGAVVRTAVAMQGIASRLIARLDHATDAVLKERSVLRRPIPTDSGRGSDFDLALDLIDGIRAQLGEALSEAQRLAAMAASLQPMVTEPGASHEPQTADDAVRRGCARVQFELREHRHVMLDIQTRAEDIWVAQPQRLAEISAAMVLAAASDLPSTPLAKHVIFVVTRSSERGYSLRVEVHADPGTAIDRSLVAECSTRTGCMPADGESELALAARALREMGADLRFGRRSGYGLWIEAEIPVQARMVDAQRPRTTTEMHEQPTVDDG